MSQEEVRSGIYEHYKGRRYLVLGIARHSETAELLVVYVPLYELPENGGVQMAVRPLAMFVETVDTPEGPRPRFQYLSSPQIRTGVRATD